MTDYTIGLVAIIAIAVALTGMVNKFSPKSSKGNKYHQRCTCGEARYICPKCGYCENCGGWIGS